MPRNPYEPPGLPVTVERAFVLDGVGTFDLGQCLQDAWDDTWKNFPLWLGVLLLAALLMAAATVTVVGFVFVVPVLGWGLGLFYLNMTDQRASVADLFAGFSNYGQVLIGVIVLTICTLVVGLVGWALQIVAALSGSNELGVLVGFVWSVAVVLRFYFAILFLIDRGAGPIASLQLSWRVTRGQTLKLIVLWFVGLLPLALVYLARPYPGVVLALSVVGAPASVTYYLMWTSAYRQLVGRPAAAG